MKPYIRFIVNKIRFSFIKLFKCHDLKTKGLQLFSLNSKFIIDKNSSVSLGDRIINDGRFTAIVDDNAELYIGNNVYFNEGNMISAKSFVKIGEGCQFGPNVKIFDNNHNFNAIEGVLLTHNSSPIEIGRNCWIGTNCVILKGTRIGDNCVIAAGCIIKGTIPDSSIVSSNVSLNIKPIEDRK